MAAALVVLALGSLASANLIGDLLKLPNTYPDLTACAKTPSFYSCENTTAVQNTCCSPTPGGLVLLTQFWSTYTGLEKKGQKLPKSSWTIHGLWPDNCDGSYEQYCDLSRQYDPEPSPKQFPNGTLIPAWNGTSVDKFILEFGRIDLLDYMNKYWIAQNQPNPTIWAHEFAKHATCTSTFDLKCYANYKKHQELVDYYQATIRAFQQYPTFNYLAAAGILPSNKTTYALADIQQAIVSQVGSVPYLGCSGPTKTQLSEIWYFSHVYGTEQFGRYKTIDSTSKSNCNATQPIWYYERASNAEREVRILP